MPSPVDKYFDQVKKDNPLYSDEQAWATAWSIYCKHKKPNSEHCHRPPEDYLKGQGKKSMDKEATITPNVEGFLTFLTGALTQYDQQASTKRGYNPYALGHYLKAKQDVEAGMSSLKHSDDPEALNKLKAGIQHHFTEGFPPAKKTLKAIDAFLETGRAPKYPTTKRTAAEQVVARYLDAVGKS
jgi:hypothetical protein